MNKNLCIVATSFVPLNLKLLAKDFASNSIFNLKTFVPNDILAFYENHLPALKEDFCKLNDTKRMDIDDDKVFNKYLHDKNYILVEAEITFSVETRKIIDIQISDLLSFSKDNSNDAILLN